MVSYLPQLQLLLKVLLLFWCSALFAFHASRAVKTLTSMSSSNQKCRGGSTFQTCQIKTGVAWFADLHSFATKGLGGSDRRDPLSFAGGGQRHPSWPGQGGSLGGALSARAGPHMSAQVHHSCPIQSCRSQFCSHDYHLF